MRRSKELIKLEAVQVSDLDGAIEIDQLVLDLSTNARLSVEFWLVNIVPKLLCRQAV